jgi:2'-5' RNA ligase
MDREAQHERFEQNWNQNKTQFGTKTWDPSPDFLFFIEIPLPTNLVSEMESISLKIQELGDSTKDLWIPPKKMHITLALPGRMGFHFQGNDANIMNRELKKIISNTASFAVELQNLNCFPNAIFREVIDPDGQLFALHETICSKIPFAQNPEYQFTNFLPHISLYYGDKNKNILNHPDFARELPVQLMNVERVFFGKAMNKNDEYEKHILEEYTLQ